MVRVEEMQAVDAVLYGKYTMKETSSRKLRSILAVDEETNITQGSGKSGQNRIIDTFDPTHDLDLFARPGQRSCEYCHYGRYRLASAEWL
ncbi:hypothetical protein [Escherichia coli]|uniref:hypothetical protein n=1 Tax=Escherichia coli TaxID=562 RepID=UPI003CC91CE2